MSALVYKIKSEDSLHGLYNLQLDTKKKFISKLMNVYTTTKKTYISGTNCATFTGNTIFLLYLHMKKLTKFCADSNFKKTNETLKKFVYIL